MKFFSDAPAEEESGLPVKAVKAWEDIVFFLSGIIVNMGFDNERWFFARMMNAEGESRFNLSGVIREANHPSALKGLYPIRRLRPVKWAANPRL
jgi:hypothetical protein